MNNSIEYLTSLGYAFSERRDPWDKNKSPSLYVAWQDGESKFIPTVPDKPVRFTCGGKYKSDEELRENRLIYTVSELYDAYFHFTEDQKFFFDHRMDKKSWDWLEAEKKRIGLLRTYDMWCDGKLNDTEDNGKAVNAEPVSCLNRQASLGQIDGEWYLEIYCAGVDEWFTDGFVFAAKPDENAIRDAPALKELAFRAGRNPIDTEVDGMGGSTARHWTENAGVTATEKLKLWELHDEQKLY